MLVRSVLFASGTAAAGDHLHLFHVERGLRRRAHGRCGRRSTAAGIRCGARAARVRPGAGAAAGIRSCAGAAGVRRRARALAAGAGAARFRAGNPNFMTHMIAQLRGISGQLIGFA